MPKLTNTTNQAISTHTGHKIGPRASITVSKSTLDMLQRQPYVASQIRAGNITVADEAGAEITRTDISKASRSKLVDIIIARTDLTEDDLEGITVTGRDGEDGLRDVATRLVLGEDE